MIIEICTDTGFEPTTLSVCVCVLVAAQFCERLCIFCIFLTFCEFVNVYMCLSEQPPMSISYLSQHFDHNERVFVLMILDCVNRVISQYHLLQRLVLRIGDAYEVHICILEASSIAFASFVCLTLFSQLLEI